MTAVIEASRPSIVTLRRREAALQAGAHLIHLLVEVARNVPHLRDPVAVVLQRAKRPPRGVAEIGPEGGVRIGRHLVVAESLVGDQHLDLRTIDVVVHLLAADSPRAVDGVELLQHVLPVLQTAPPATAGSTFGR